MPFTDSIKMVDVIIANKTTLNATPSDVLQGKQFIGAGQTVEVGSVPILSRRSDITIVGGETYNIPYGYNPASYNVSAKKIEEETAGTATSEDILSSKTAWVNGVKLTGTMTNIGKESATLACGAVHNISCGYHDGTGSITAMSLKDQTYASVLAEDVKSGYTCWANGVKLTGTMAINSDFQVTLSAGQSYSIPAGYHSGNSTIAAQDLSSQTQGNATAREIIAGYSAWVNGEKVNGTVPMNDASTVILPVNGSYSIPNGYHTGFGKVTQNIPSKQGQVISPTKEEQTIEVAGYYMEGNIVVSGVNALNYKYENIYMKDSSGNSIVDYDLTVTNGTAEIDFAADNWHDGNSINIYKVSFTDLVDATTGNVFTLECDKYISNGSLSSSSFGNVSVSVGFDSTKECQYISISGITGGKVTITSILCAREY